MTRNTVLLAVGAALQALLVVLAGCSSGPPAPMPPAYVGTWHIADQRDPTTLTFGEDTFTFTVGDGTTVLQPLLPPEEGMEAPESVLTMLTVSGSLAVEGDSFKLTVPEDGVVMEFVEAADEVEQELLTGVFTAVFVAVTEMPEIPMRVEIDEAGTTMTITGLFGGLLTPADPLASLTACKDEPCQ